ncbi:MAG: hypoxanthine/guanine phosphoribosyltransferase [Haloarculaceae archaeon]
MERLQQSLREAPIVEKEGYHYFVHPVSDGVPMLEPALLREIIVRIIRKADLSAVDKIVAPEAMGIHISTGVSLMTDIPLVVVRKRDYGLEGEVSIEKVTGYAEADMYLNDVYEGDRVVILDDVLSTGGTLDAITGALEEIGAEIVDIVCVIKKVGGENKLADAGYDSKTLVNVDIVAGELVIVDAEGDG